MIIERGARPDAPPKPKRSKTALIALVGVGVGLVSGLGLGVGLGANFARVAAFGSAKLAAKTERLSLRERFLQCSEAEAEEIPRSEELEAMLARWRARYAEPRWGTNKP